jgi:hypothetical protein
VTRDKIIRSLVKINLFFPGQKVLFTGKLTTVFYPATSVWLML